MFDLQIEELVFDHPNMNDVAWEHVTDKDWNIVKSYRGDDINDSIYCLSLEEQFMYLCFVVQAEDRPILF